MSSIDDGLHGVQLFTPFRRFLISFSVMGEIAFSGISSSRFKERGGGGGGRLKERRGGAPPPGGGGYEGGEAPVRFPDKRERVDGSRLGDLWIDGGRQIGEGRGTVSL